MCVCLRTTKLYVCGLNFVPLHILLEYYLFAYGLEFVILTALDCNTVYYL